MKTYLKITLILLLLTLPLIAAADTPEMLYDDGDHGGGGATPTPSPSPSPDTAVNFSYDANGNRVSDGSFYYEYDNFNQLVSVRNGSSAGPVIEQYAYDGDGNRLWKFEPVKNQYTYYVDGSYVEVVNASGSFPETYYFENGVQVARKDSAGQLFFLHPDHLGSTTLTTNAAGQEVETTNYEPFGALLEGSASENRFTYTGKEQDQGTGLYYYGARYYDSARGQFTQPDPTIPDVYKPQALNRYAYVLNNPYKYTDPDGRMPVVLLGYAVNFVSDMPWLLWDVADVIGSGFGKTESDRYVADFALSVAVIGSTEILGEARLAGKMNVIEKSAKIPEELNILGKEAKSSEIEPLWTEKSKNHYLEGHSETANNPQKSTFIGGTNPKSIGEETMAKGRLTIQQDGRLQYNADLGRVIGSKGQTCTRFVIEPSSKKFEVVTLFPQYTPLPKYTPIPKKR